MTEWWTYSPADFLMFSPRTYARLVENYNRELWPGPVLALLLGGVALAGAARGNTRACAAVLVVAWAWVAGAFHWQRHAQVNIAAPWFAAAFAFQAALIAVLARTAGAREPRRFARTAGLVLAALGVVAYPFLAPLLARPWTQAEAFGWMPEPTALATLGLVLAGTLGAGWRRVALALVPAAWLALGATTQWLLLRG